MAKKSAELAGEQEINFDINPEDIKEEYMHVPGFIATLNQVYARAKRNSILAKHNRDKVFAMISEEILDNLGRDEKEPSIPKLKNRVLLDSRYQDAVEAYALAEEKQLNASGRARAMDAKKDMIVSLGAHVRQELEAMGGGGTHDREDDDDEDEDDKDED